MYFVLKIHLFFGKNKNTQITDIVIVVDRKFFHGVKKKKKNWRTFKNFAEPVWVVERKNPWDF